MIDENTRSLDRQAAERLLGSLTQAQVEVLDRVLQHKTSKEIARELGIAPNTVDQRIKAVWPKLGTSDRPSTARRYALLKSICGQTTYGQPVVDLAAYTYDNESQELPDGPLFIVEDSANINKDFWHRPPTLLETLDAKFGPFGRIGAILFCAISLAVIGLVVTAIAVTFGDLV